MSGMITLEELIGLKQQLTKGLKHFEDSCELGDDTPIYAEEADCLFEFAFEGGRLQVGHLRKMLMLLEGLCG